MASRPNWGPTGNWANIVTCLPRIFCLFVSVCLCTFMHVCACVSARVCMSMCVACAYMLIRSVSVMEWSAVNNTSTMGKSSVRRLSQCFVILLRNDIVPVVMGAAREDYRKVAPPHSFIHVDDFASPRELAAYLRKLDADDALYNDYFRWKGTGHFINTKFWCRVCAMAHAADEQKHAMWYENIDSWIHENTCREVKEPEERWSNWDNKSLSYRYLKFENWVKHQVGQHLKGLPQI